MSDENSTEEPMAGGKSHYPPNNVSREEVEFWSDNAIKRLDHVHDALDTVLMHIGDSASHSALNKAQEMVEEAQADVQEIEEHVREVEQNG